MGYVANLIFCENANQTIGPDQQSKINATGLLGRGSILSIPSYFSLSLVVIFNDNADLPIQNFKIVIKNPDDDIIFSTDEMPKPDISEMPGNKDEIKDLILTMSIQNLIIDKIGKYRYDVYVNREHDYSAWLLMDVKEIKK